jgi:aspartyl-tRNA(Asn)/glutamyl-tRNA(Gln) amidotransferase subunit B
VELVADPSATAAGVAKAKGFEAMDTGALEAVVDQVLAENPTEWEQYRTGDDKARKKLSGFFTGKIMKATQGQADGREVARLLAEKSA